MTARPVRVRMAPSPTGYVHLGSARTALYNQLFARGHSGVFVLRLEDTDLERNRPEYEEGVYEGLRWLGLRWDEGPDVGGPHGPYRQSERMDLYRDWAARLIARGSAYRCYCTREELQAEREAAERERRPYRYSRRCRDLDRALDGRTEFAVRFRSPLNGAIGWEDAVRGPVAFEAGDLDDFIIMRSDATPLYNFCVAVDDVTMEISHVFRGEEHVSNTPRQLLVLEAMGAAPPVYAHLPVIIGKDRAKLSKRKHPEVRLSLYQEQGYLPEAVVNYLALLGWNPGTEQELFTLSELERVFDLARVQRSPAMFDWQKLDWLDGQYIRRLPAEELAERLRPFLPELDAATVLRAVPAVQERLAKLAEARDLLEYLWSEPARAELDDESGERLRAAREVLAGVEWSSEAIEAALDSLREARTWSRNALFKPIRLAVTGKAISPPIDWTLALLPREEALRRIDRVLGA